MDLEILSIAALILLGYSAWWFYARNEVVPFLMAVFNFLFVRRFYAIEKGYADWVSFNYGIGFEFGTELGLQVSTYMLVGTAIVIGSYCAFVQSRPARPRDDDKAFNAFLSRHRIKIIVGFVCFSILNALLSRVLGGAPGGLAGGSGYAYLFTLANSSFIILMFLLVRSSGIRFLLKVLCLCLIVFSGLHTFSPSLRFQFLGWSIAVLLIATSRFRPLPKLLAFGGAGLVIAYGFTLFGLMRDPEKRGLGAGALLTEGVTAMTAGHDYNMLDGFIMLVQVYPQHLEHGYGMEHLEILARPIPRAIWPNKPVGGWQQKFAQVSDMELFGTGISPSIYGSFYGEGGVPGIVVFSVIYGFLFARFVKWSYRYGSDARWMLRGILAASLFAIIRGGDLPGIVAFIAMSYWPIGLFVWKYNQALRERRVRLPEPMLRHPAPSR